MLSHACNVVEAMRPAIIQKLWELNPQNPSAPTVGAWQKF